MVITLFVFTGMFLGLALGLLMPWIDQEKLLPYNVMHLVQPFLIFVLPNIFIMACLFFASGALSRKLMMVYVQGIMLFMLYAVSGELMENMDNQYLGALLDPFGIEYQCPFYTILDGG